MSENILPVKKAGNLTKRRTLCISPETDKVLCDLEKNKHVHIPALLRIAIDEYVERHELDKIAG